MQPDRGKTFAHQAPQVTCLCQFLVLSVGSPWKPKVWPQLLTTDRFGFHGHLWKATAKAWSLKTLSLQRRNRCSTQFEYRYFWKFADTVTSLKRSNNWSTWIQLMCFFACHCLHLCRRLNIWKNPEVFDLIPIYNRFMIDGHPLPQRCNRHSRWHFPSKVAISGKCLRMREKNYNPKMLSSLKIFDIWEFFFIWRMRKTEPLQVFQLVSSTKAYPIQSCIGAVQEIQSIVEAWIASKRLLRAVDKVVQQVVSISQRLCRFAYSFYIIIVFNTTIQRITLSLLPGWMFPSSISLGSTFAEAQPGLAAFGWPTWQKMKNEFVRERSD